MPLYSDRTTQRQLRSTRTVILPAGLTATSLLMLILTLALVAPAKSAPASATSSVPTAKNTTQSPQAESDTAPADITVSDNVSDEGQNTEASSQGEHLTVEQLQSHLDVLDADKSLDPVMRDQAAQMYRTAISRLQAAQSSQQAALNYLDIVKTSQETLDKLETKLQAIKLQSRTTPTTAPSSSTTAPATSPSTSPTTRPAVDAGNSLSAMTLETLEQQLASNHFQETALRGDLVEIQSSLAQMAQRPTEARREMIEAREKLVTLDRTQPEEAANQQTIVSQATRALLASSRIYWPARINELEQELVSLPKRRDLLIARRKLIEAQFEQLQRDAQKIAKVMDQKRQALAAAQSQKAKAQAEALENRHPLLVNYADETAKLSSKILDLTRDLTYTRQERVTVQGLLLKVQGYDRNAGQILEIGAVGEAYGQLLLALRQKLPDANKIKRNTTLRQQAIVQAKLEELKLHNEQESLGSPSELLKTIEQQQQSLINPAPALTDDDRQTFEKLAQARNEVIDLLLQLQSEFVDDLKEVNGLESQLLEITESLSIRLDERLIWLPSMPRIDSQWFKQIGHGLIWISSPTSWLASGKALVARVTELSAITALILILVGVIFYQTRRMKRRVIWIADQVGRLSTDSFIHTPQVIGLTILLALPWALLIGYTGWLLRSDPSHQIFTQAVGRGMMAVGILLALLGSFAIMCRDQGLFGAHFRWHEKARKVLGHNLQWLIVVECIAAFFVATSQGSNNDVFRSGLGRLAFLLGSIGLCYFVFRVFHPQRGVLAGQLTPGSWLWRVRVVWYTAMVAPPLILGVLAIMGYYQTASQIQSRLFTTAWVVLVGLIFYSMGMRTVVVAHRRLAVKRAKETRQKAIAAKEANKDVQESGEAVPHMLDLPDVDLSSVSDQTRTLLRWLTVVVVGVLLWMLWSELVPAVNVLRDITLWNGTLNTEEGPQAMPITLLAVLTGLVTVAMTLVAARNLPGLLEITAISRLSLDSGTRYAIAAISRYIIIVIGLLIAFDQIGIQWSKMQWIVAALGVGLGFGLQEVVANFVSGMIILFERPVRVGDTVTVDQLSGTISRIQIRATTIVDWDNREILVPNKSFITEQVVNWTLSDPVTRLVMKVGIAYGSDTALAHKLMMDVVKTNPMVLDNPPPTVFFLGFGDSSLDFEVRIFVNELTKRMLVLHEVHMAINKVFAENKIEIPFPQRDLHIRSSDVKWPVLAAGQPAQPTPGQKESQDTSDQSQKPHNEDDDKPRRQSSTDPSE